MRIGKFLAGAGLLAALLLLWKGFLSPRPHRPNVVLIIVDALRADKLGCYGFPGGTSPEIDALAADGVLFENAFSLCCWTRPSIGTMLTGLYPRTLGIYKEGKDILADRFVTVAEALKAKGYGTIASVGNPNINKIFNFQQGFDEYQDSRVVWKWMKPATDEERLDGQFKLRKSLDIFEEILSKVAARDPKRGPVYVQTVIMEVHTPWIIRPEYRSAYPDYPVVPNSYSKAFKNDQRFVRETLGAVRQVSHDIDEFIRRFRAIPGRDDTLFVITSDHGQGLDDHPDVFNSLTHGNLLYQSHLKVPLIFYHPVAKGGQDQRRYRPHRVSGTITLLDLMPTILDYAGLRLPRAPKGTPHVQGRSQLRSIRKEGADPKSAGFFVAETHWRNLDKIALYNDKWMYIQNRDRWKGVNPIELQMLGTKENGKKTDRISREKRTAAEMRGQLNRWLASHEAAKPEFRQGDLSKKEIQQLKSLGYLK